MLIASLITNPRAREEKHASTCSRVQQGVIRDEPVMKHHSENAPSESLRLDLGCGRRLRRAASPSTEVTEPDENVLVWWTLITCCISGVSAAECEGDAGVPGGVNGHPCHVRQKGADRRPRVRATRVSSGRAAALSPPSRARKQQGDLIPIRHPSPWRHSASCRAGSRPGARRRPRRPRPRPGAAGARAHPGQGS